MIAKSDKASSKMSLDTYDVTLEAVTQADLLANVGKSVHPGYGAEAHYDGASVGLMPGSHERGDGTPNTLIHYFIKPLVLKIHR